MTDVLGTCISWADGFCVVQPDGADAGAPVRIPVADIVSGKPVPPRTAPRLRVEPQEAQLRALALWPDLETWPLGAWLLRRSAESTARRANSVLAMSASGVDGDYEAVVAFYDALGQRPIAAVLPDSAEDAMFRSHGWVLESHDEDTVFLLSGVAQARRSLAGVTLSGVDLFLEGDDRLVTAEAYTDDGRLLASGVAAVGDGQGADQWVGFRGIEVDPGERGRGFGLLIMAELLEWGAERGATTAYLQVLGDNARALRLYDGLGFVPHHRYRYLAAP